MLIKIPLDIWRDIFDYFLPSDRRQLALKFSENEDREFSDIFQKWLHEWTKNVRLGRISIMPPSHHPNQSSNELVMSAYMYCPDRFDENTGNSLTLPFAEVPMPDNIVDFKRISISYLDANVLQLLHHMQPLFRGIKLSLFMDDIANAAQITIARLIMPMFADGIETITLCPTSQLIFTIRDQFPAQFYGAKLLKLWSELENDVSIVQLAELLLRWLCTRRADGEPRMLIWENYLFPGHFSQSRQQHFDNTFALIEHIRQHFFNVTSRANFFVSIWEYPSDDFQESTTITKNAETNEQLVVRKREEQGWWNQKVLIGRCPSEVDGQKWVEEIERKASTFGSDEQQERKRRIVINSPELGQLLVEEEEESGGEDDDGGEDDVNQPGTSTKR